MIRECGEGDIPAIDEVINEAAMAAYKDKIPSDCWREPYMSRNELLQEIANGVKFWAWEEQGDLSAVMGLQEVGDVVLIRHAYVRPERQRRGLGVQLVRHLSAKAKGPLLVGTWADATWAIQFYQRHGFRLVAGDEKDWLLNKYWRISERQREVSVVLSRDEG
jgi:N-acetylglutamate synthase-like GNAT family acetyltransferase